HRDATILHKQLAAEFPAVPEYRQELGRSQDNLGNLLSSMGRFKDAEDAYRDALLVRKQLTDESPNIPDYHGQLARTMSGLARISRAQRNLLEARELLESAVP